MHTRTWQTKNKLKTEEHTIILCQENNMIKQELSLIKMHKKHIGHLFCSFGRAPSLIMFPNSTYLACHFNALERPAKSLKHVNIIGDTMLRCIVVKMCHIKHDLPKTHFLPCFSQHHHVCYWCLCPHCCQATSKTHMMEDEGHGWLYQTTFVFE